jgi:hypothetical protein
VRRIGLDNCPYCGSLEVYRSHPKDWLDRACALFLLEVARCHYCMQRYYRPLLLPSLPEYPPKKPVRAARDKGRNRTA